MAKKESKVQRVARGAVAEQKSLVECPYCAAVTVQWVKLYAPNARMAKWCTACLREVPR